jgi:hypothetical protein
LSNTTPYLDSIKNALRIIDESLNMVISQRKEDRCLHSFSPLILAVEGEQREQYFWCVLCGAVMVQCFIGGQYVSENSRMYIPIREETK